MKDELVDECNYVREATSMCSFGSTQRLGGDGRFQATSYLNEARLQEPDGNPGTWAITGPVLAHQDTMKFSLT